MPLERKLKDMLETDVEEKYYITSAMMDYFMGVNQRESKFPRKERFLQNINRKDQYRANSITTNPGQRPTDNFVLEDFYKGRPPRTYKEFSPTLRSGRSGLKVAIRTANKQGYDLAENGDGVDLAYPQSSTRRGRVGHGICKTIPTSDCQGTLDGMRIRKLTPKECWRLMGFDDEDFEKAARVNSNTQLYKQAGNSIVVDVLIAILGKLLKQ